MGNCYCGKSNGVQNLFFYGVLNYINAWNNSIWGIIVLRSLIAIPMSAFFVVVTGILTDIFREKERAFWLVGGAQTITLHDLTDNVGHP